jgi:8-oxo-dGTP diphosphatase
MLVIDAANVIGSRPTGWWRDFTERVRATVTAGRLSPPVTIVLEGEPGREPMRRTWTAWRLCMPSEGDDTIAAIGEANREVDVVTTDRELAERVRAANAEVVRPSWLLEQLVD